MGRFSGKTDYHYQCLRTNVDIMSVIQLGITLFDENGDTPPPHPEHGPFQNSSMPCPHTWQFNFKFNMETDMYNEESIKFLQSVGMNMEMHELQGIEPAEFGAMMITSGLALFEDVKWISFHAAYDFAYLTKLMHCKPLPENEDEFRRLLTIYFPSIYDIKYITKSAQRTHTVNGDTPLSQAAMTLLTALGARSGLQDLADELNIKRIGQAHTAGSDSHITGRIYWEFKRIVLDGVIDDDKYLGQVWGFNGLSSLLSLTNVNDADATRTPNLNGATIYNQNGTPSTPGTSHTNPVQTPNQSSTHARGIGAMTPGGGGGAFGQFFKS
jgi:CCR4-NOT transcription complex subunit 7/8